MALSLGWKSSLRKGEMQQTIRFIPRRHLQVHKPSLHSTGGFYEFLLKAPGPPAQALTNPSTTCTNSKLIFWEVWLSMLPLTPRAAQQTRAARESPSDPVVSVMWLLPLLEGQFLVCPPSLIKPEPHSDIYKPP